MPDVIAAYHDNFLKRLVYSGEPKIVRKYRMAVGKNKEGYIFPIKLYVNYYWGIKNDFCVSALALRIQSHEKHNIITDQYGFIHELT